MILLFEVWLLPILTIDINNRPVGLHMVKRLAVAGPSPRRPVGAPPIDGVCPGKFGVGGGGVSNAARHLEQHAGGCHDIEVQNHNTI